VSNGRAILFAFSILFPYCNVQSNTSMLFIFLNFPHSKSLTILRYNQSGHEILFFPEAASFLTFSNTPISFKEKA